MPGMGGVAATQAIRALPGYEMLPIVAMTANVMPEQVREFRDGASWTTMSASRSTGPSCRRPSRAGSNPRSRPADETSGAPSSVFDAETFEAIAELLGPQKTLESLEKFKRELAARLHLDDLASDRREAFQRDAHVVTSIAGMLGFEGLAQRCAAVVSADLAKLSTSEPGSLEPGTLEAGSFEADGLAVIGAKMQTMERPAGADREPCGRRRRGLTAFSEGNFFFVSLAKNV